ncbi:MAG: MFS transporter [Nitrososphaeria archaeon]
MQYKYTVLTNTTLSIIMSSMNMFIVMISLPTIFRGLNVNPFAPGEFVYLLWVLMGYSIVLASVLVTLGRISDMYGRTRIYTWGFVIFTAASIALSLIPSGSGNAGLLWLILLRMVQAVGGGILMVNGPPLLTEAFPPSERGKALGINQVSFIVGSFLGLILGGVLSGYDWHLIFVVNVPFALAGMLWSIFRLRREKGVARIPLDVPGNVTLAAGLISISLGLTYALMPYGSSPLGWGNPWVIASFIAGAAFLIAFALVERRQSSPLFDLRLFRIRPFAYGVSSLFMNALARGAIMFLVTIWLQGIYLPLHGISYAQTPFWAGVYMLPMMVGTVIMGPIGGILTDRYGARAFEVAGMAIIAVSLYLLTLLPYNFNLLEFELILFVNGLGNGLYTSPNMTSIMNALHPKDRAVGNGMRQTMNNIGQTLSMALFFTIAITVFTQLVPSEIMSVASQMGLPRQVASFLASVPPTGLLFATFLGINPASALPTAVQDALPPKALSVLNSNTFLPSVLGNPFVVGLRDSIYISLALVIVGALFSAMKGGRYVYEEEVART